MTSPAKKLLLPLAVCISLFGCNTVSDVTTEDGGDLDWAHAIADGVVFDLYGEGLVMFEVKATYLDIRGFLYGEVQHPYWRFSYISPDGLLVRVIVHPHGSTTVTEDHGYFTDEIPFTYTSADVRDWLDLARSCYRQITGRADDVCYALTAACYEISSKAMVVLFDSMFLRLASVLIDMTDGTIIYIYFH